MGTSLTGRIWPIPKIEYCPASQWRESRSAALVYSRAAWEAVGPALRGIHVVARAEAIEATEAHWDSLAEELRGEVVYAVGGGLAVDAAKYVAVRRNLPLICIPTALSVDAFLTWASGVRRADCVRYIETKPPDLLVVDLDLIAASPPRVRAAGICDVLSIATGCADWEYAHAAGKNPSHAPYIPYVADVARGILRGALECAEAAGRGDTAGLKQLLDCLALEVQLCNLIGHSRPEEGSEHYFAYAVENILGKGLPHGDLVGPGILYMARALGIDPCPLERAMCDCAVPLSNIPADAVRATLESLPDYCRRNELAHGIAHDLDPSRIGALLS